jgi:hypothetical protein
MVKGKNSSTSQAKNLKQEKKTSQATPKNSEVNKSIDKSLSELNSPINKENNNDTKEFTCSAKKIFITIKGTYGEDYINHINNKYSVEKWVYGNEKGETGYEHTHVTIEFNKKQRIQNSRVFDYKGEHPNFSSIRNWQDAVNYTIKCGKYKSNFKINKMTTMIDNICNQATLIDALKENATDIKDFNAIINVYNNKQNSNEYDEDLIEELERYEYNEWQTKLLEILSNDPDKRKVYWICDEKGGAGKSQFCDKYEYENPNSVLTIASTGSMRDIGDVIRNWKKCGNKLRTLIFDLPRTATERESIYTSIENIKNGRLTCTKYSGTTLRFKRPHVVIFANWMPEKQYLSEDRWDIYEIKDMKLIKADDKKTESKRLQKMNAVYHT